MQSLKTLSTIFLYQQMIAIKNIRKKLFISSKKVFFILKIFRLLYFSHSLFSLSQPLLENEMKLSRYKASGELKNCRKHFGKHWFSEAVSLRMAQS